MIFFFLSPLTPSILIYLDKKRQTQLTSNEAKFHAETDIEKKLQLFKFREILIDDQHNVQKLLVMSWKVDNVLENTPQLLIQFLIVLMSASMIALPDTTGIQAVFDTHSSGSSSLSLTFYYFSILLSLRSICLGLFSSALLKKDYNMPDAGKVLNILNYFCGTLVRIMAIILFFAPTLGILNMMLPFSIEQKFSSIRSRGSDKPSPYGENITDVIGAENINAMADKAWYTGMTLWSAITLFPVLLFLHLFFMISARGYLWRLFKAKDTAAAVAAFYHHTLHALSCILVPDIRRDWDERWGETRVDKRDFYMDQYRSARQEYGRLVWLYTIENILLSLPSLYTFSRHIHRHTLVTPLDAEMDVVNSSYVLIFFFPGFKARFRSNFF